MLHFRADEFVMGKTWSELTSKGKSREKGRSEKKVKEEDAPGPRPLGLGGHPCSSFFLPAHFAHESSDGGCSPAYHVMLSFCCFRTRVLRALPIRSGEGCLLFPD